MTLCFMQPAPTFPRAICIHFDIQSSFSSISVRNNVANLYASHLILLVIIRISRSCYYYYFFTCVVILVILSQQQIFPSISIICCVKGKGIFLRRKYIQCRVVPPRLSGSNSVVNSLPPDTETHY